MWHLPLEFFAFFKHKAIVIFVDISKDRNPCEA